MSVSGDFGTDVATGSELTSTVRTRQVRLEAAQVYELVGSG
jgi:hypothetical protein